MNNEQYTTMTEQELKAIEARMKRADKENSDLRQGHHKWTMSIPVQDDDSDMIFAATTADVRSLLAELRFMRNSHKRLWARAATAEGSAALFKQLLEEARQFILEYVPSPLLHTFNVKHFLQRSDEALHAPSVEEKQD